MLEQAIAISEDEIRAWTKDEHDQILLWTDSLMGDAPLPRPEFLEKYTQAGRAEAKDAAAGDDPEGEVIDAEFEDVEGESSDLSPEDMAAKISDLGATVTVERVREWSVDEIEQAQTWIAETQEAINGNQERRPAPEFFFK